MPGENGDYSLVVKKSWDASVPSTDIPETIDVVLYLGDIPYREAQLSVYDHWMHTFTRLVDPAHVVMVL